MMFWDVPGSSPILPLASKAVLVWLDVHPKDMSKYAPNLVERSLVRAKDLVPRRVIRAKPGTTVHM